MSRSKSPNAALPTPEQLNEALQANAAAEILELLPKAVAVLDHDIKAGDFEPTLAATALAKRANGAEYTRAARALRSQASLNALAAALDLSTMVASAGFALGLALGLRMGGPR